MTESEWLSSDDPARMLERLQAPLMMYFGDQCFHQSDRKLRLFACACCRDVWDRLDGANKLAVECGEKYADGVVGLCEGVDATHPQRYHAKNHLQRIALWLPTTTGETVARRAASTMLDDEPSPTVHARLAARQAALLRDIVGNPFRPVTLAFVCSACGLGQGQGDPGCAGKMVCPRLTPDVLNIATAIYAGRTFDDLPVLADALEEAGCGDEAILNHLRGMEMYPEFAICGGQGTEDIPPTYRWRTMTRSSHVRGCWALDLVLGLE